MSEARFISEVLFQGEIDRTSYLKDLPVVKYLRESRSLVISKNVTFFVGENGTGKSTLLEAIAVAFGFNAEGGSRNFNFSTMDTHSELCDKLVLRRKNKPRDGFFLRAESVYNVATNIDKMDSEPSFDPRVIEGYGGLSLHKQSHGESFLSIVANRFFGNGLYILDEPEAALSPMRLMTLMTEINRLVKNGSQLIIATHSPILMTLPDSEIFEFTSNGIKSVTYKETEHYQITKRFLNSPERMLGYLLDNDI